MYLVNSLTKLQERSQFKLNDFKINLDQLKPNAGSGGGLIRALTVTELPALQNEGISLTLLEMEPCKFILLIFFNFRNTFFK